MFFIKRYELAERSFKLYALILKLKPVLTGFRIHAGRIMKCFRCGSFIRGKENRTDVLKGIDRISTNVSGGCNLSVHDFLSDCLTIYAESFSNFRNTPVIGIPDSVDV